MKVAVTTFRKAFKILCFAFLGVLILEYISTAIGHPLVNIYLSNRDTSGAAWRWFYQPILSAIFVGGIFNFFLTVKVIKESKQTDRLPAAVVVVLTITFALGIFLGCIFLIPNAIIFGIKGRLKNQYYEVDFRN